MFHRLVESLLTVISGETGTEAGGNGSKMEIGHCILFPYLQTYHIPWSSGGVSA
jgi:hypothetical protein